MGVDSSSLVVTQTHVHYYHQRGRLGSCFIGSQIRSQINLVLLGSKYQKGLLALKIKILFYFYLKRGSLYYNVLIL